MIFLDYGVLKSYRKKMKWKQSDVAKKMNCTAATISRWELGITPITAEDLARMADIYEIKDMREFFVLPLARKVLSHKKEHGIINISKGKRKNENISHL